MSNIYKQALINLIFTAINGNAFFAVRLTHSFHAYRFYFHCVKLLQQIHVVSVNQAYKVTGLSIIKKLSSEHVSIYMFLNKSDFKFSAASIPTCGQATR